MPAHFVQSLATEHVGVLHYKEIVTPGWLSRHYEASDSVRLDGRDVRFIVWPPKSGVGPELARFVDRTWGRLMERLDTIRIEAVPIVQAEVARSYDADEPHPPAADMLKREELLMIKFNAEWESKQPHELMFSAAEFIGGHDLGLYLDADLRPTGAYFDG